MTKKQIEEERRYADHAYENRAELEREAVGILDGRLRQLTLRIDETDIERAKRQAKEKGLKYQSYMKSLLHVALAKAERSGRAATGRKAR
jgi:predicted DNA binding CopG/RHH family protein